MNSRTALVPGISCGHCVMTIQREVGELEGVTSVSAEQEGQRVTVTWDESVTSWEEIKKRLVEIHYVPAE